jgi:hypothetical protein
MAIARKPQVPKVDVDKLIRKGGSVAGEKPAEGDTKPQLLQLRLPRSLVGRIDETRESRLVPPSRHAWLLEAIHEKLQREEKAGS